MLGRVTLPQLAAAPLPPGSVSITYMLVFRRGRSELVAAAVGGAFPNASAAPSMPAPLAAAPRKPSSAPVTSSSSSAATGAAGGAADEDAAFDTDDSGAPSGAAALGALARGANAALLANPRAAGFFGGGSMLESAAQPLLPVLSSLAASSPKSGSTPDLSKKLLGSCRQKTQHS